MDLLFLGAIALFYLTAVALTLGCHRLGARP